MMQREKTRSMQKQKDVAWEVAFNISKTDIKVTASCKYSSNDVHRSHSRRPLSSRGSKARVIILQANLAQLDLTTLKKTRGAAGDLAIHKWFDSRSANIQHKYKATLEKHLLRGCLTVNLFMMTIDTRIFMTPFVGIFAFGCFTFTAIPLIYVSQLSRRLTGLHNEVLSLWESFQWRYRSRLECKDVFYLCCLRGKRVLHWVRIELFFSFCICKVQNLYIRIIIKELKTKTITLSWGFLMAMNSW